MERLAKERGTLPVCSEYLQSLLELVYMLRAVPSKHSANTALASVGIDNNITNDNISSDNNAEKPPSSPSSPLLEIEKDQQQTVGPETTGQGQGLEPLSSQGVPQLEGRA